MVFSTTHLALEGSNVVDLDIAQLVKGTYILQVINGSEVFNTKMQIEK